MERILALDIGHVRVGVAVSDPLGFFAQGIGVLSAAGDWLDEISTLVEQYDVRTLLIGLPVRTDGSTGQGWQTADDRRQTSITARPEA